MKVVVVINSVSDKSALIARVLGYTVHESAANGMVTLRPALGWSMMVLRQWRIMRNTEWDAAKDLPCL